MSVFLLIKWVHVLSASIWIGGIIFTIIVNRMLRRIMNPLEATRTLSIIGRAMQLPMRFSLYIAIITGPFLLIIRGIHPYILLNPVFYLTPLGSYFLLKLIAVSTMLALIPLHSKYGKKIARNDQDMKEYAKDRRRVIIVGWITFLLSVLIIYLGTGMRLS